VRPIRRSVVPCVRRIDVASYLVYDESTTSDTSSDAAEPIPENPHCRFSTLLSFAEKAGDKFANVGYKFRRYGGMAGPNPTPVLL